MGSWIWSSPEDVEEEGREAVSEMGSESEMVLVSLAAAGSGSLATWFGA